MKQLIGVFGASGRGKSSTLNKLIEILMDESNGFTIEMEPKQQINAKDDYTAIFCKHGKKVGISTSGDAGELVNTQVMLLVKNKCDVILTATRTKDSTVDVVIEIAKKYKYEIKWFEKNQNMSWCNDWPGVVNYQEVRNSLDAGFILGFIMKCIHEC